MAFYLSTIFECTESSRSSPVIRTTSLNSIKTVTKMKMRVNNHNLKQGLDQSIQVKRVLLWLGYSLSLLNL